MHLSGYKDSPKASSSEYPEYMDMNIYIARYGQAAACFERVFGLSACLSGLRAVV